MGIPSCSAHGTVDQILIFTDTCRHKNSNCYLAIWISLGALYQSPFYYSLFPWQRTSRYESSVIRHAICCSVLLFLFFPTSCGTLCNKSYATLHSSCLTRQGHLPLIRVITTKMFLFALKYAYSTLAILCEGITSIFF